MSFFSVLFIVFQLSQHLKCEHYMWSKPKNINKVQNNLVQSLLNKDVGSPLILTPYLEKGQIKKAKTLSMVSPPIENWPSYSGYFTVNKGCGSNIFFWFFLAKKDWQNAPVLLWLQGGPGASSMYGLFEEIGPFNHFPNGFKERHYTWNKENSVIYMDQPIGTGYSFTQKKCYAQNMTVITEDLYSALKQFFQMFPELQKNKFFLTGESFAGHYIPPLAIKIHNSNPSSQVKIPLKGTLIGNTLTKLSCHNYANFLHEWGAVDVELRDEINTRHKLLKKHADEGKYKEAYIDWDYILNNIIVDKVQLPSRESMIEQPVDKSDYIKWIATTSVRRQIHVGEIQFNDINWDVYNNLIDTIAEPMTKDIEQLLQTNKYTVGFYNGNLDMICLYTSTECMIRGLKWFGAADYLKAKRHYWFQGDTMVGWHQMAGPLYEVVIKDAGHSVPFYRPAVTYQLIQAVVSSDPGVNPASKLHSQ